MQFNGGNALKFLYRAATGKYRCLFCNILKILLFNLHILSNVKRKRGFFYRVPGWRRFCCLRMRYRQKQNGDDDHSEQMSRKNAGKWHGRLRADETENSSEHTFYNVHVQYILIKFCIEFGCVNCRNCTWAWAIDVVGLILIFKRNYFSFLPRNIERK